MQRRAILITGAARRVGAALALDLAARGHDIALHYHHSENDANEVAEKVRAHKVRCELFRADLTEPASYDTLVSGAHLALPHLGVLINNASLFNPGSLMESDEALFHSQFTVNTQAPIFLTQSFARHVKQGVVINMLDTKITASRHSYFFYLLSKKTLAEFTRMAAAELGPDIRVNAVCPGHILPNGPWDDAYQARLEARLPLRRIATLDEVCACVYSLIDNKSLTGQYLFVDGGGHLV